MTSRIILASASPRRKELLKKIINDFQIIESGVDESTILAESPQEFAEKAAQAKAQAVVKRNPDSIVIGADTIVVLKGRILGKPKDKQEAISMLTSLAGRTHEVMTGIAVVFPGGKTASDVAITKVTMKNVSDETIMDYVATGKPLDKAGAYGIQEIEEAFIDSIEGDYDNVVGLPVLLLQQLINQAI
ncbi:MAG: Maf family protein [bacterium]